MLGEIFIFGFVLLGQGATGDMDTEEWGIAK